MIVGTAEGGTKVTLYYVNQLQINTAFLNKYYFLTMHHEFAHILHQTKNYDPEFDRISEGSYTGGDWYNVANTTALREGFVDGYASSSHVKISQRHWLYILPILPTSGKASWIKPEKRVAPSSRRKWNISEFIWLTHGELM